MLVDQGTNFDRLFIKMAAQSNVEVQKTAIEVHSSLGLCKRFHQPLRTIYRKIMVSHPETDNTLALSLAVKAMNDTLGPEGFVPSALVFGEYPEVHTESETPRGRLNLQQRSALATSAREECQKIMAKMKVSRALRHKTSRGATQTYEVGSKVLVWRERVYANRIGEWIGPFSVVNVDYDAKQVYIRDCDFGPAGPFSLWQVKPYHTPENVSSVFMTSLNTAFAPFRTPEDEESYVTETLHLADPRYNQPLWKRPRRGRSRDL